MSFAIAIRPSARADLFAILEKDRAAGVRIADWLEDVEETQSQRLLDSLTINGYEDDTIDVRAVESLQRRGLNIWRVKLASDEGWLPYRILYAFDHRTMVYHVLRIVPRKGRSGYQHELSDPITQGCIDDIGKLGIPLLPRR